MQIDPNKSYEAVLKTEIGDIRVRLFSVQAPVTVNNFVFLAREGYYDNTTFHRVLPGFMAQGGDPTGTGAGGPGYTFKDEFDQDLQFDRAGLLAMANRGPNTNGGQFFITYAPTPHLTGLHTIFGEVLEGAEVLNSLTPRDPQGNPDYQGDTLVSVEIIETDG
jgi:cyclophilin family peptidyl-prolyl cis-trans isomerase